MTRILRFFARLPRLSVLVGGFILIAVVAGAALLFVPLPVLVDKVSSSAGLVAAIIGLPSAFLFVHIIRDRIVTDVTRRFSDSVADETPPGGNASGSEGNNYGSTPSRVSSNQSLSTSFRDALGVLRKRRVSGRMGGRWLYQLPWYLLIGPPGSGKTTAVTSSGLSFPLADKHRRYAAPNTANRRDLNWCFTDEAVLLDSDGRFTMQDSNPSRDRGDWLTLLSLLKRHRRRQPLNGVVVTIGIDDLMVGDDASRLRNATVVRQRMGELYKQLGARLPVYVFFTKSDLLAGFAEYFDDLGREGRDTVLGITFQPESLEQLGNPDFDSNEVETFASEYDALIQRLEERLLERMQHETDIGRRALVFGLPQQLMSLKERLSQFLYEAFAPNTFDDPILVRGTYFVSGTQTGAPIDAVADAVARTFHVQPSAPSVADAGSRSYFLGKLFREVVFLEAWLVEKDGRLARRMRRVRSASVALIGATALALAMLSFIDYRRQDGLITKANTTIAEFERKASGLKLENVTTGDLRPVVPLLDDLAVLKAEVTGTRRFSGWMEPAFFRGTLTLENETRQAYNRALNTILLPLLLQRLETQLAARTEDSAFLYAGLHVYLMLGGDGTFMPEAVRQWMTLDWGAQFPQPSDAGLRTSLSGHLEALLDAPRDKIGLDAPLIERTRVVLRKTPIAQRVFNTIVNTQEARAVPEFDIATHSGPSANEILQLRSGEPLSSKIPGLFTRDGFFGVYIPLLSREAESAIRRAWILEDAKQRRPTNLSEQLKLVMADTTGLYLQEFSFKWDQLINGIAVKPIRTFDDALRTLNILSAPTSPVRIVVATAAEQTSLAPPAKEAAEAKVPAAQTTPSTPDIAALFPVTEVTNTPESIAAKHTAEHFRSLQQLVRIPPNSGPNAQAPIDGAIAELATLYRSLTAIPDGAASPLDRSLPNAVALQRLPAAAANLPEPIRQWVSSVVRKSSDISIGEAKSRLAELWLDGPGKFCSTATERRYPFAKNADRDIPLTDFGRLFAQQGITDEFFSKNLGPFLDATSQSIGEGVEFDKQALAQFQNASAIRDSMFKNGGTEPAIDFDLRVSQMDATLSSVVIDIHGQRLVSSLREARRARFKWPPAEPSNVATLTFFMTDNSRPIQFKATGEWALFRLIDMASVRRRPGSDVFEATFKSQGYEAVLELQADRLLTPLSGNLLSQFRCPEAF